MSRFPTEPIGHVTPRPPIEINPRHCVTTGGPDYVPLSAEECARIWDLVVNAARGSNVGSAPVISEGMADDWRDVDAENWDPA